MTENKCKNCFFSEISLHRGSYNPTQNGKGDFTVHKLWCWDQVEHVNKNQTCNKWLDKTIEGDPKTVAQKPRKEGLPSIMIMDSDPFLPCPKNTKLRCDCYKTIPCLDCTINTSDLGTKEEK